MMSDRRPALADRRRVRKLVIRDQPVDTRDLNIAERFVRDTSRFRQLWIGLIVVAFVLLLVDIALIVGSGHRAWVRLATPPLLILAGASYLRDHRRAQRWAAHHLNSQPPP